MAELTFAEREARAWSEYRAWSSCSAPSQYVLTEELAWQRLQDELLAIRTPAGTFAAFSHELAIFTPDAALDDLDVIFEPAPDLLDDDDDDDGG